LYNFSVLQIRSKYVNVNTRNTWPKVIWPYTATQYDAHDNRTVVTAYSHTVPAV
jgi:hypothetical protein